MSLSEKSTLFDDLHDLEEGDDDIWAGFTSLTGHNSSQSKFLPKENDESFLEEIRRRSRKTPDFRKLRAGLNTEHLVFVYGTLKRDFYNQALLKDAHYLGLAVSAEDNYLLYGDGGFPVLFRTEEKGKYLTQRGRIRGEVYGVDLDTLCSLDMLESNGVMYHRQTARFVLKEQNLAAETKNCVHRPVLSCFVYIGDDKHWKHIIERQQFQTPNNSEYGTSLGWRD